MDNCKHKCELCGAVAFTVRHLERVRGKMSSTKNGVGLCLKCKSLSYKKGRRWLKEEVTRIRNLKGTLEEINGLKNIY